MTVQFYTSTVMDFMALRTFGLSVKEGVNPIGKFGTGLKYAIAVILRLGGTITIHIDGVEHRFKTRTQDFRGVPTEFIICQVKRVGGWTTYTMPFTTSLGKHWEAWMAFRELESNTRDENGETSLLAVSGVVEQTEGTLICVDGADFDETFRNMDQIFLPKGEEPWIAERGIEVYRRPSQYLWYRGIRVFKLTKPSMFTYNFVREMELTEDRTFQYQFYAEAMLVGLVQTTKQRGFVNAVVRAKETRYEYSWPLDQGSFSGPVWENVVKGAMESIQAPGAQPISPRVVSHYNTYYAPALPTKGELFAQELQSWLISDDRPANRDRAHLIERLIEYLEG